MTAETWIARLGLKPHPEGGHYAEVWRDLPVDGSRGAASTIYFLLKAGEKSLPHRVDAVEIWLWHAGAALELEIGEGSVVLGAGEGESLQATVPPGAWQAARSLGDWTLVSCVVAPEFRWEGFEMRPGESA